MFLWSHELAKSFLCSECIDVSYKIGKDFLISFFAYTVEGFTFLNIFHSGQERISSHLLHSKYV